MLVLSRKQGEKIVIDQNIEIVVVAIEGTRVRLGITAPRDIAILRAELQPLNSNPVTEITVDLDEAAGPQGAEGV